MGVWDDKPWDNDTAADWFFDLFDSTGLADRVVETLQLPVGTNHRKIRAAAAVLIYLGRIYVWTTELEEHLKLALERMEEIIAMPGADKVVHVEEVKAEASLLRARLEGLGDSPELAAAWSRLR